VSLNDTGTGAVSIAPETLILRRVEQHARPQPPNPFSLSDSGMNPREALPYLRGAVYLRVSPKVKAETDPMETNRTRPARIPLSWRTKVQQTTTA
jgi:hypothetical protein